MANEREPSDPLPVDFQPDGWVAQHRVSDGEDWGSVAAQYDVDVMDLIEFNFHTTVPEEVNWYLRRNVGCNVSNDGGLNWAFSSSADPGIVYIPRSEAPEVVDMEPLEITVDTRSVMERLREIAAKMTGPEADRVRAMMDIATKVGSPADEQLWFYNGQAVFTYIQLRTTNDERREMTKDTNGQFPFDGDAGVNFGNWRITPFHDVIALDAANHQTDSDLETWLRFLDHQISKSWEDMVQIHDVGGGTTEGLVAEFLDHVVSLAKDPNHLYSVQQTD
jgi:hypothetical protein